MTSRGGNSANEAAATDGVRSGRFLRCLRAGGARLPCLRPAVFGGTGKEERRHIHHAASCGPGERAGGAGLVSAK